MKLSELFNKPFKVKGGGTLNLKGFSKHIIDKELGGGEITPESITPEMLKNDDFQQRIRLWGHTVEEVEQLIADGKCVKCRGTGNSVVHDTDALYMGSQPIITPIDYATYEQLEYILIAANDIPHGLLLKKLYDDGNVCTFADVLDTFTIHINLVAQRQSSYIGYDSI